MSSHPDARVPQECMRGRFGIRRRHTFQPRYDHSGPASLPELQYGQTYKKLKITGDAAVKRVTYVHDVCTRCGMRIKRL